MKFHEEFSNTVVRPGGLHSALNYLSSLGKKFRFYVLALGNISVYGLIIFMKITFFLMIFNKSIFPDTKQSGVQFVLRIQSVNRIPIWRSFVTIKDSSETIRKKLRSLSSEVSSNNMLTTILRPLRQDTAREFFWRRALFGPANHIDKKRPKLAETDSSTLR